MGVINEFADQTVLFSSVETSHLFFFNHARSVCGLVNQPTALVQIDLAQ